MPASRVTAELRAAASAMRHVRLAPTGWGHPLRAAGCMAVPLSAGVIAGHASYGMVASLGALSGLYGQGEPYRRRARLHAVVACAFALAAVAGTLSAPSAVAAVLVVGALTTVVAFTCIVLEVGPPREHMIVLVALMTATLPLDPSGPLARGGLVLAGGAVAWLIAMSGWLTDPSRPERIATANALGAVAALLDAIATDAPSLRIARHQAALAARSATHAVAFAAGRSAAMLRAVQRQVDELLDAVVGADVLGVAIDPAWPQTARALAQATRHPAVVVSDPHSGSTATTGGDGTGLAPPGPRIDAALARIADALDGRAPTSPDAAPAAPHRRVLLRHSLAGPAALRAGVTIAVAIAIGHLLRVGQPYWIALTVSAVLQGSTLVTSLRRGIERTAGTLVGVFIAAGLAALEPAAGVIVAFILVLQLLIESVIATSYAVAVAFITPLTLLLSDLGRPGSITDVLLGGRIVDTLIGAALGIAAGRLLWPSAARTRVPAAASRSVAATGLLLLSGLREGAESPAARRDRADLHVELLNLRAVADAALADRLGSAPVADLRWPVIATIERLGYLAGGAPFEPDGVPAGLPAALEGLTRAAATTDRLDPVAIPDMPRTPNIHRELCHLAALLAEPR
jgi:uncharacterized membrane protein YccC